MRTVRNAYLLKLEGLIVNRDVFNEKASWNWKEKKKMRETPCVIEAQKNAPMIPDEEAPLKSPMAPSI
jgi:hypothetical protein